MTLRLRVTGTEWRTPALRRVWFSGELAGFEGNDQTDRYLKLIFPPAGVELPDEVDVRALRGELPPEQLPVVRTYTALFPDVAAGTLAIDFVVHGTDGVAGPWAATCEPGDEIRANGPGGGYRPDPSADAHLLAGDESAVPAITAALAEIAAAQTATPTTVVIVVDSAADEPDLPLPADAAVRFVHARGSERERALTQAVRALDWPSGRIQAFVHGEADDVMHGVRPYLLAERGLPRADVSISGYWRRGRDEEGFRAWKSELRAAEEPAPV